MKHNDETVAIRDRLMELADSNKLVAASVLTVFNDTCRKLEEVPCRKAMVSEFISTFLVKLQWEIQFAKSINYERRNTLLGIYGARVDAIGGQIKSFEVMSIGDVQDAVEQLKNIQAKLTLDLNPETVSILKCRYTYIMVCRY